MEVSSSGAACHADVTDRLTESHAVAFLQADANSAQLAVVHGAAEMAIDVFLGPRADHQSVSVALEREVELVADESVFITGGERDVVQSMLLRDKHDELVVLCNDGNYFCNVTNVLVEDSNGSAFYNALGQC